MEAPPEEQVPHESIFTLNYEFQNVRRKIRPLFQILGKSPKSDLERLLGGDEELDSKQQVDRSMLEEAQVRRRTRIGKNSYL
jgi:hypothetical protein